MNKFASGNFPEECCLELHVYDIVYDIVSLHRLAEKEAQSSNTSCTS